MWIPLVEKFGGQHNGYYLPSEGANNIALCLFTFPSLAAYEEYRTTSVNDSECQAAFQYAEESDCVIAMNAVSLDPFLNNALSSDI